MNKPLNWFEIPTGNIEKARDFYEAVFEVKMRTQQMGHDTVSVFPYNREAQPAVRRFRDLAISRVSGRSYI